MCLIHTLCLRWMTHIMCIVTLTTRERKWEEVIMSMTDRVSKARKNFDYIFNTKPALNFVALFADGTEFYLDSLTKLGTVELDNYAETKIGLQVMFQF